MHIRHVIVSLSILVSGVVIGTTAQQLVSADATSGERPVLVPITPCRLADTRTAPYNVGPRATKLGVRDTATFTVQQTGTECTGRIPSDAVALSLNVTATDATAPGSFITIWSGGSRPNAASLNPAVGQPPTPNAVTTELAAGQQFDVYNDAGSVNVVIDVNGYYVDHNHDDRYVRLPTPGEVQTLHLSSAAFQPISNVSGYSFGSGSLYASTSGWFIGAVTLPDGARITEIRGRFTASNSNRKTAGFLLISTPVDIGSTAWPDELVRWGGSGPGDTSVFEVSRAVSGPNALVDNSQRSYSVLVNLDEHRLAQLNVDYVQ